MSAQFPNCASTWRGHDQRMPSATFGDQISAVEQGRWINPEISILGRLGRAIRSAWTQVQRTLDAPAVIFGICGSGSTLLLPRYLKNRRSHRGTCTQTNTLKPSSGRI